MKASIVVYIQNVYIFLSSMLFPDILRHMYDAVYTLYLSMLLLLHIFFVRNEFWGKQQLSSPKIKILKIRDSSLIAPLMLRPLV